MAYGSPQSEEDVEPYYTHIRHGKHPSEEEVLDLKRRYRAIGGRSPLSTITESTAVKLEERLKSTGNNVRVFAGMKHWHPFIEEVVKENIAPQGITDLLAIALAPHYSKMSIGSYEDAMKQANAQERINVKFVPHWYKNLVFIQKWAERIREKASDFHSSTGSKIFFLFSAHSLPKRILSWGDPYMDELLESTNIIASKIPIGGEDEFGFAFQSAGHTSEPWLDPDVLDKLEGLASQGWKNVLVAQIGFVSDHLEVLYDLDIEAKEKGEKLGIKVERAESFNDSSDFIDVLQSVVMESRFLG